MTLSVTIYFPVHCGHTGSPDWGDVPHGRQWVESRPRRLRPCGPVRSCGPVPFAVAGGNGWSAPIAGYFTEERRTEDSLKNSDVPVLYRKIDQSRLQ